VGNELVSFLRENFEDVCLAVGVLCVALGTGIAFGYAFGLVAFGVCAIAYGVWITVGSGE
jgi:hypothetical protein